MSFWNHTEPFIVCLCAWVGNFPLLLFHNMWRCICKTLYWPSQVCCFQWCFVVYDRCSFDIENCEKTSLWQRRVSTMDYIRKPLFSFSWERVCANSLILHLFKKNFFTRCREVILAFHPQLQWELVIHLKRFLRHCKRRLPMTCLSFINIF